MKGIKLIICFLLGIGLFSVICYSGTTKAEPLIENLEFRTLQKGDGLSFANQVTKANTVYEICHSFDLGGKNVSIPEGCVLKFSGGTIQNGTIIGKETIIEAAPLHIFGEELYFQGRWKIKDVPPEWFGAVGNGTKDDSGPLQKALNFAAICDGQKVGLLGRSYLVNSPLDVPAAIEVCGVYSKNDASLEKSTVIVCNNKSINNQNDGLLRLGASVYLHDLKFWYPKQAGFDSEKLVITYSPSILVKKNSDYVTIERIAFAGSFIGIRAEFHKNLTINSCVGYCFKYGIYDLASHDIDRITDCHFNFNYLWQNGSYSALHPWPNGAFGLYRYSFQNETAAFKIGQCDWIVLTNCFAYGYNTGFEVGSTTVANHNLSIIGGGSDSCKKGISLTNCHYAHLTDITVTHGDSWGSANPVKVSDRKGTGISILNSTEIKLENVTHQFSRGNTLLINNSSRVIISNCNYRATGFNTKEDWAVMALGTSSFSLTNCVFSGWGTSQKGIEGGGLGCIAVIYDKKGSVTGSVSNCRFDNCTTLCNIEGGTNAASNTHYILQSNNTFSNLLYKAALRRMRDADINYGTTAKRKLLSTSGVWNSRADGQYWDTDLKKPVYWTGGSWVDANGNGI